MQKNVGKIKIQYNALQCLLDIHQFSLLTDLNNNDPWLCESCSANNLPFNDINDSNFFLLYDVLDKASDDLKLYPDESFAQFTF